jgi:uncharacterized membrane-anchored protein YitT (DUF2179 family)
MLTANLNKKHLLHEFKDYVFITLGLMIYSVAFTCFILPYQITGGGVTGLCSIIYYATGFEVQYSYLIINAMLLIAAIKILGFRFCMKTVYAVLMLTFLLGAVQELIKNDQGQLPCILGKDNIFMACVIGSCMDGLSLAIVFLNNGSTGGTDIIAAIINKYRDVTLGRILLYCDVVIISSSFIVFHDYQKIVFGFSNLIIANLMLDYVMNSAQMSVQFLVFSEKFREIAKEVNEQLNRGVTVLHGEGFYTGNAREVLVILAKKRESAAIFRIIKELDPNAFVSQSKVVGVFGEGFDRIKVKVKKPNMQERLKAEGKLPEE